MLPSCFLYVSDVRRRALSKIFFQALPDTSIARVAWSIYAVHTPFRPPRFHFPAVLFQQDYGSHTDDLDDKCRIRDTIMADINYTDDKGQNSYLTDVKDKNNISNIALFRPVPEQSTMRKFNAPSAR